MVDFNVSGNLLGFNKKKKKQTKNILTLNRMPMKVQSLLPCSFNIAIHAKCHANQSLFTEHFASVTKKKKKKKAKKKSCLCLAIYFSENRTAIKVVPHDATDDISAGKEHHLSGWCSLLIIVRGWAVWPKEKFCSTRASSDVDAMQGTQ